MGRMLGNRRRSSVAVAWLAALLTLPPAAPAAPDATVVAISDPGDYIGAGTPRLFTEDTAKVFVVGDSGEIDVRFHARTGDSHMSVGFAAPDDENLARGVYERAQRVPFMDDGRPGLDVDADYRGCNKLAGRFEVRDIGLSSRGEVDRLWVVFEQHCEGGPPALFGELRMGQPAVRAPMAASPTIVRWPAIDPGRKSTAAPVAIEARRDVKVSKVSVVGSDRHDFAIAGDGCSGQSLRAGRSCQVVMRFQPTATGTRVATLRVIDSKGRRRDVVLEGFVYGGRTRLLVQSEPGDPVGAGRDWSYSSANATITANGTKSYVTASAFGDDDEELWELAFGSPRSGSLAPGPYPDAENQIFSDTHPYIEIGRYDAHGCSGPSGAFTIGQIAFHPDGGLKQLAATFEQRCAGQSAALRGLVEFRAGDTVKPARWMVPYPDRPPVAIKGTCAAHHAVYNVNGLRGTKVGDRIGGSRFFSDAILAGAGDDVAYGREMDDCIDGGPGNDHLDGGPGRDVLDCGPGRDSVRVTKGDRTKNCERVRG
jgi:hypothetical protein